MPKKSSQKTQPVAESAVQTKPKTSRKKAPKVAEVSATAESSPVKASRQAPTRDSVQQEFDALIKSVDDEITRLRASAGKSKGVKFLRTVNKCVKTLKTHALRVARVKTSVRRTNTNSGFLKPVQLSQDLSNFVGWKQGELHSRVEVTKFICNY